MRIRFNQLAGLLKQGLAPVYLVCGDEPLQLGDAARAVREAARGQGFDEREVLEADGGFEWSRLAGEARSLSLFASRRLIELRLAGARIGAEGGQTVRDWCDQPPPDVLLLIVAPDLEYRELSARWVKAVEAAGVVLQVRPVQGAELSAWVTQRLRARGLTPSSGVAELLAERVEGNLLAAAQEIETLALLHGGGTLDREGLLAAIGDSARYDVFALADALLGGDRARVHRILTVLAAEGTAPALVLWALVKEVRMLAAAAFAVPRGASALAAVLDAHKVWQSRRGAVQTALRRLPAPRLAALVRRCAEADAQIKGQAPGDPWLTLAGIADELAGGPPPPVLPAGSVC